ncbi:MAG: MCE family protein [Actinomycetota bacterium]
MRSLRVLTLVALSAAVLSGCGGSDAPPDVVAFFTDVGDLVEGATVQTSDVEVGSVNDISLVTHEGAMAARVEMSVKDSVRISSDGLTALVRQTSLLGEQFVELVPSGTDAPFVGDEPVEIGLDDTARRVDIESFLADLSGFIGEGGLEDLNRFTHAQAVILEDRGARFGETLDELELFTGVLADRRLDLGAAIDHLAAATSTVADNQETLDSFLDSLEDASALLAGEGDGLQRLFRSLRRFGEVNARFLARHEGAIKRQFRALRPVLSGLAGTQSELRTDIAQLATFFELFPQSMGGGPGGDGAGDYTQVEAVLCEDFSLCSVTGEKGNVPGAGS